MQCNNVVDAEVIRQLQAPRAAVQAHSGGVCHAEASNVSHEVQLLGRDELVPVVRAPASHK